MQVFLWPINSQIWLQYSERKQPIGQAPIQLPKGGFSSLKQADEHSSLACGMVTLLSSLFRPRKTFPCIVNFNTFPENVRLGRLFLCLDFCDFWSFFPAHLQIFGVLSSTQFRVCDKFVGTGQCFLYTFHDGVNLKVCSSVFCPHCCMTSFKALGSQLPVLALSQQLFGTVSNCWSWTKHEFTSVWMVCN